MTADGRLHQRVCRLEDGSLVYVHSHDYMNKGGLSNWVDYSPIAASGLVLPERLGAYDKGRFEVVEEGTVELRYVR